MTRPLGVGAAALAAALALGCERLVDAQIERNLTRRDASVLASPDLRHALIAGGAFVLVEVGPGARKSVDRADLPVADLAAVLPTHLHSDPIGNLGEAITQSWAVASLVPVAAGSWPRGGRASRAPPYASIPSASSARRFAPL